MSEKVTIPAELRGKLVSTNGGPVPMCDDAGNVVAYSLTPDALRRLELRLIEAGVTEAELDEAEADGGAYTTEDVLKLLEGP